MAFSRAPDTRTAGAIETENNTARMMMMTNKEEKTTTIAQAVLVATTDAATVVIVVVFVSTKHYAAPQRQARTKLDPIRGRDFRFRKLCYVDC